MGLPPRKSTRSSTSSQKRKILSGPPGAESTGTQSNSTFGQPQRGFAQTDNPISQLLPAHGPLLSRRTPLEVVGSSSKTDDSIVNRSVVVQDGAILSSAERARKGTAAPARATSKAGVETFL